jgi:site-specific DNA recombinase
VSVWCCAPYGYRYVTKQDGAGEARFEIDLAEARVVRQIFTWVGRDRCSSGEVRRRLEAAGERTRTGKTRLRPDDDLGHPQKPGVQGRSGVWQNRH